MSSDAQVAAIKALVAAATKAPCYDHDEAQKVKPAPARYTIVYYSRRFGGNVRGGSRENPLRRLQTRAVARTAADVRLLEDRTAELFEHSSLDVDGVFMHFGFEGQDAEPERDDDGYYERLTDWTTSI